LLNYAATTMLKNHVPQPNIMGGMMTGMPMMGTPTVFGSAGMDSNHYLDVHNLQMANNQCTFTGRPRPERRRQRSNVRYSASNENGFMPQNLPGFDRDNASKNGSGVQITVRMCPLPTATHMIGTTRASD
jgi:hypothetical protein